MQGLTNVFEEQADGGVVVSKGTLVLREDGALALENQLAEVDPDSGELDGYATEDFVVNTVNTAISDAIGGSY